MAAYTFFNVQHDAVLRAEDGGMIPWDTENQHPLNENTLSYRRWVDDGSPTPDPYVAPEQPLPTFVPKVGLVRELMDRGDWQKAKAFIAKNPDIQDLWDATTVIVVADPMTRAIVAEMQYDAATEADVIRGASSR